MKIILLCLLIPFLSCLPGTADDKKERHLFLLIGQSNMAGRAQIEALDEELVAGAFLWNIGDGKWETAKPPYNRYSPSRKAIGMQRLNCGPSFVKAYLAKHPNAEVGIVCAARGGSKIEQWEKGNGDQFDLYRHAIEAAKAAIAEGGVWKGILWHQGEGNSLAPAEYPAQLADLVANLRADLSAPELPFIFSQLGQWNGRYEKFNQLITTVPATIPRTSCVSTEGLVPFDEAHFDSPSQRTLGERYAAEWEKIANKADKESSKP